MRRFHNPRYAPESLERKLSPSGFAPLAVAAEVYVPSAHGFTPHDKLTNSIPDGSGDPPIDPPSMPDGPALPA